MAIKYFCDLCKREMTEYKYRFSLSRVNDRLEIIDSTDQDVCNECADIIDNIVEAHNFKELLTPDESIKPPEFDTIKND